MEYTFAKLHGCGNDFVFIDDRDGRIDLSDDDVRLLCDRHFGIGADGVILVQAPKSPGCDAYMHYINSDGSLAQMCGNGVRCFAKYLVDRKLVPTAEPGGIGRLFAETLAGMRLISYTTDDQGFLTEATVDMGEPVLDPVQVPVDAPADSQTPQGVPYVGNLELSSPWGPFRFTCISMGNPHAVCFIDDFSALPEELFTDPSAPSLDTLIVDGVGAFFESHPAFPEKANIEFAVVEEDALAMRVYERGCGETLACGTGACATLVAAVLNGLSGNENAIRLRGGTLYIRWDEDNHVFMTGPAVESFRGTIKL